MVPELNRLVVGHSFVIVIFYFLEDVNNLFNLANEKYAVMCVQHDYKPKEGVKMDGKAQTLYPRKNWSFH